MLEKSPSADSALRPLRILFVMAHAGYSRNYESTLKALAERGHRLHVALDRDSSIPSDERIVERLAAEYPAITTGRTPLLNLAKRDPRLRGVVSLRRSLDHLHYFKPAFRDAPKVRLRAAAKAPAPVRWLSRFPLVRPPLAAALKELHGAVPPQPEIVQYIREISPDVVLVTPLIEIGSPQLEYVRAAHALGIPAIHCVASWDNLTTKGTLHELPDLLLVWNEAQRDEAASLHGVPRDRVAVTGAGAYDHWFSWQASTTHADFCARVGLSDDRPFVLYLGSSEFIAPNEERHVAEWLHELRSAPATADLGVVIRPHPTNPLVSPDDTNELAQLVAADPLAVIYPRGGSNPTTVEARRDYYDSLHHATAAVGINTSGLIESAIVGCPVFVFRGGAYREAQEGMLHFHHLSDAVSGTATEYPEHLDQLAAAVRGEVDRELVEAFVERFVRPHGVGTAATPQVVHAVETLARCEPTAPRTSGLKTASAVALASRTGKAELRKLERKRKRKRTRKRTRTRTRTPKPPRSARRAGSSDGRLRILFAMHYPGYLRYFDSILGELVARGHSVQVCFDSLSKQNEGLDALESIPGVEVVTDRLPPRLPGKRRLVRDIRRTANYLHYLDPAFASAEPLRSRARKRLPTVVRPLGRIHTAPRPVVRRLRKWVLELERAIPISEPILKVLEKADPDLVIVSPLVVGVSPQADLLEAAAAIGTPGALAVASWDHLTTKGMIRVVPEGIFVWNDIQRREAIDLHGMPAERLVVTGAQPFDKWFDREPSCGHADFCRKAGLDPEFPVLLFVGSTASISPPEAEQVFVRRWIDRVRERGELADLGILVRPHPYNCEGWRHVDLAAEGHANAVVWPRHQVNPVLESDRTDYFDSLYHAVAVVGINTSAMVEASILGRPVLTVTEADSSRTQGGTLHFHYLLPENGGFVRAASDLETHVGQLASIVADPEAAAAGARAFVERFVRPMGIDRQATTELADAIEATALLVPARSQPKRLATLLWQMLERLEDRRTEKERKERKQRKQQEQRASAATRTREQASPTETLT